MASPAESNSSLATHSKQAGADQLRILQCFETLVRDVGPRGVGMSVLAAELGISTRTLYRHFPAKTDLVAALIQLWSNSWYEAQQDRMSRKLAPQHRIEEAALAWQNHIGQFSPLFWRQLERNFPEAYTIYRKEHQAFLQRSRENLLQDIRPELNADMALHGLMTLMSQAGDAQLCEKLNTTRRDGLVQMIDIWCKGALKSTSIKRK